MKFRLQIHKIVKVSINLQGGIYCRQFSAKFWVEREVFTAQSYGMTSAELRMLSRVVEEKQDLIKEAWNEYFSA